MKPIAKLIKKGAIQFDPDVEPGTNGLGYTTNPDGKIENVLGFVSIYLKPNEELVKAILDANEVKRDISEVMAGNIVIWLMIEEDANISIEMEMFIKQEGKRIERYTAFPTKGEAYWQVYFDLSSMCKDVYNQSLAVFLDRAADNADEWAVKNKAKLKNEKEALYEL